MLLPNKEYLVKPRLARKESYVKQFTIKHRYLSSRSLNDIQVIPKSEDYEYKRLQLIEYSAKPSVSKNNNEFCSSKDLQLKYLTNISKSQKSQINICLPFSESRKNSIWNSSVSQLEVSRSLAKSEIVKIIPKFSKKYMSDNSKNDYLVNYITTGSPIPSVIKEAICHLYENATDLQFIFRKAGSAMMNDDLYRKILNNECVSLLEYNNYVISTVVSKYLRNSTEPLFTKPFTDLIHCDIDKNKRLNLLRDLVTLLPDTNREVLIMWIRLLNKISKNSEQTHMTAYNLSVCLCETIFTRKMSKPRSMRSMSSKLKEEIAWKNQSIEFSETLINQFDFIFEIEDFKGNVRFIPPKNPMVIINKLISDLYQYVNYYEFEDEKSTESNDVELKSRLFEDTILKIWRCQTFVNCGVKTAVNQIFDKKIGWFLQDEYSVTSLTKHTEIVTFKEKWIVDRICYMIWHKQSIDGNYAIVGRSLEYSNHGNFAVMDCQFFGYFIEPRGKCCKLTHFISIDPKGRSLNWNNTVLGKRLKFYVDELRKTLESTC